MLSPFSWSLWIPLRCIDRHHWSEWKNCYTWQLTSSVDAKVILKIWNYHPATHWLTGVAIASKKTDLYQVKKNFILNSDDFARVSHCLSLQVFVVDNYFTGRKRNIEHWLGHENFEMIQHDIVNPILLEVGSIFSTLCFCVCQGGWDISSCVSSIPSPLYVQPSQDNQDKYSWNCQYAGACQENKRNDLDSGVNIKPNQ